MSNTPPPHSDKPRLTMVSVALIAVGLLILVPSGLCAVVLGPAALLPAASGDFTGLLVLSIVAGPAIAIGVALIYAGLNQRRHD